MSELAFQAMGKGKLHVHWTTIGTLTNIFLIRSTLIFILQLSKMQAFINIVYNKPTHGDFMYLQVHWHNYILTYTMYI